MKKIAFLTCSEVPSITDDDKLIAQELLQSGYDVSAAVWDDQTVNWNSFDLIIIRNCWDYHLRYGTFLDWLENIKKDHISILNMVETVKWNSRKLYLNNLKKTGIEIPETFWLDEISIEHVSSILTEKKWTKAVLKPQISASSYNTKLITPYNLKDQFNSINLIIKSWMLQEYVPEIVNTGEVSLIYLGGYFSHAVNKIPSQNEFRSQPEFRSKIDAYNPSKDLLRQTHKIISTLSEYTLYARIDGFLRGEKFILMELELIEPYLFLSFSDNAVKKMSTEIIRFLNSS